MSIKTWEYEEVFAIKRAINRAKYGYSEDQIKVTEKGKQFHKDYSKINELIQELSIQN